MPDHASSRPSLREVRESDFEYFYEFQADPSAVEMAASGGRDRDALVGRWYEIVADPNITARTIVVGDAVAGHLVSWKTEAGHHEVGYWIGRPYWGSGIATAALGEFLRVVTHRPLEGWAVPHNVGSARVLEKNGFVYDRDEDGYRVFRLD